MQIHHNHKVTRTKFPSIFLFFSRALYSKYNFIRARASVKKGAVRCGEALGPSVKAGVVALDAMLSFGEKPLTEEREIEKCFDTLEKPFDEVRKSKKNPYKKTNFKSYNRDVEDAYERYMSTEAYAIIQKHMRSKLTRFLII